MRSLPSSWWPRGLGLKAKLPAAVAFIFGGVLLAVIGWKVHRLPTAWCTTRSRA
jgi:hypothetical protein